MRGTKYLSELLTRDEILSNSNTLVVAPCGSGKSTMVFSDLVTPKDKVLYLCDNSNLKSSILKNEITTEQTIKDYMFINTNVEVMTYKKFGMKMKFTNTREFLKNYSFIVCDEIHNLIDYQEFKNDGDLSRVIEIIFNRQEIPIVLFTATPYLIESKHDKYNKFLNDVHIIDYSKSKEIIRYIDKRRSFISHLTQVQCELGYYNQYFEYGGGKALIFTPNIRDMKLVEQMALNLNLNPICIWSEHNKDNEMNSQQIEVKNEIIDNGILIEPYNVLIINRAMETGVDIKDKEMQLFISTTSQATPTQQARNRIRNDVDVVILKSREKIIPNDLKLVIDPKWINTPLTSGDITEILIELNIKDGTGELMGVSKFYELLKNNGYTVRRRKLSINGKRTNVKVISDVQM